MGKIKKPTGRAVSIPGGLALSGVSSLVLTVLSSIAIGKLVENQYINDNNIGYFVMIQLFLITFISSMLCAAKVKHQHFLVCALAGLVYYGILISITALFFGGQYEALWEVGAIVVSGSILAGAISVMGKRGGKKKGKGILHC